MKSITINSGGTFDISNHTARFTASNPIGNIGTFIVTNSNVEYNGLTLQTISIVDIAYAGLIINNPLGTRLSGTQLINEVYVNDTLSILVGDLDLNGKVITVSPTGYLTETSGNTVKGSTGI